MHANNERELGWHMGRIHGWPGDEKTDDMDISCESQGVRYCVICDYEAEDMYDLEGHHWAEHEDVDVVDHDRRSLEGKDSKNESVKCANIHQSIHPNYNHIDCNFCGQKFESQKLLMEHKKKVHIKKVASCWNFSAGKCEFGDDSCWFSHSKNIEHFKCNICGLVFKTKNETHYHQKREHVRSIPKCNPDLQAGICFRV